MSSVWVFVEGVLDQHIDICMEQERQVYDSFLKDELMLSCIFLIVNKNVLVCLLILSDFSLCLWLSSPSLKTDTLKNKLKTQIF